MSGIRAGTRLEQLQDLRRQITIQTERARRTGHPTTDLHDLGRLVDAEIRAEGGTPPPQPVVPRARRRRPDPGTPRTPSRAYVLLAELGVTSTEVKTWAVQNGLLPELRRGQIGAAVVEAYARHHPTRKTGTPS